MSLHQAKNEACVKEFHLDRKCEYAPRYEGRSNRPLHPAKEKRPAHIPAMASHHFGSESQRTSKIMSKNEKTGKTVGSIAAQGLKNPGSLTNSQIKTLAGSALTQRPDHKKK